METEAVRGEFGKGLLQNDCAPRSGEKQRRQTMAKKIIDVSAWQGIINFKQIKEAGIEGVIIRAGYGRNNIVQVQRCVNGASRLQSDCSNHLGCFERSFRPRKDEGCLKEIQAEKSAGSGPGRQLIWKTQFN